ncbi:MAG: C25 family cysteine peptidase [Candidatus Electronema sp. V4]|uniref:C25 family cysteine peptidase n=1 Tax=Candidatus Electronema sp. V4 TaxID=3454756 RepID=UPI00405541E2
MPGAAGGSTPSVIGGDTANGAAAVTGTNVSLSPGLSPNAGLTMDPLTGIITVAAGTAPGTYSYPYTICTKPATTPATCDTAVATVTVTPSVDAVDDSFGPVPGAAGGSTPSVIGGDTANGAAAVTGTNVSLSPGLSPNAGLTMDPLTGIITVAAGTAPGTYSYPYTICTKPATTPATCDTAVATVTVTPSVDAVDDSFGPVPGAAGGSTPSVIGGDTANGAAAVTGTNVSLSPGLSPNAGLTMDPLTGIITVAAGTAPGTYSYPYTICTKPATTPATCDTAVATVTVTPSVDAVDDSFGPVPGAAGGSTPSVIGGDTANGAAAVTGTNVSLSPGLSPNAGLTMDPLTGIITVAAGTAPGTYSYPYTICTKPATTPATCDTAVATVTVTPSVDAVDDSFGPVPGAAGGSTPSVIGGDTANGAAAVTGTNVSLSPGLSPNAGLTMDPLTGIITVAAGTAPGTYSYPYTICTKPATTPATCDTAAATVLVNTIPTYVLINSFKAYLDEQNRVVLEWKTDSEIGTIGFLLERLNSQSGEYEAVTQELMLGMLTPPHGGEYRYVDLTAKPGKEHTYRVVEVAVNSQGAVSGPYTVRAEKPLPVNPAMQADGPEGFSLAHETVSTKQVRRAVLRQQAAKSLAAQVKKKNSKTLKVPVSKDGLVYLTADRIAAASGLTKRQVQQQLKSKKCLVTLQGKRIPTLFASNDGAFWFYGQAPARLDIGLNIYRLELGKQSAVMVAASQAAGKGRAVVGQSFVHRERLEENHMPFHLYINKPVRDFWAWEYLLAYGKTAEVTHSIAAPSLTGSGSAALTVNLVNISSRSTGDAAPYKVTVSFNGTELGSEETAEIGDWQLTMDVPASLLHESGNKVKVVSQLNSGTVYSLIYLESFELKHERKYEAANGELTFSSGQATKVTVDGFSKKNVLALDISNPAKPVRLRTAVSNSKTVADGFAVTVRTKPGRSYFITENIAAAGTEVVTADSPSQLRSGKNRADYLLIAPLHLMDSARRLAAHRQSQGLTSMVVDIEDVQDEFSHGLAAPEAVHDFLAYVHEKWAQAPRYVALVGDGSYDYRNHLLYGWPVIPSVLVATPEGFFPSDNALADVVGNDGVPEFAVGRIPVFDKTEFDRYIDKVISYEQSAGSGSMTVVNDKNDPVAGSFKASAELVAALAPEQVAVSKLDVDSLGVTVVHDRIKTAMQQGTGLLHYTGHSSLIGFGKSNSLLSASKIETMNPVGPPTLMVSMSCSAASFGYPAMNSIGESAVLRADGAAVGFFGATGLSFNHLGDIIAEGFYRSLFDQAAAPRLGDAVMESKRHYRQVKQSDDAATMDIYNLLGDPAVRMPALP